MIVVLLLVPWAFRGGGSSPPLPAAEAGRASGGRRRGFPRGRLFRRVLPDLGQHRAAGLELACPRVAMAAAHTEPDRPGRRRCRGPGAGDRQAAPPDPACRGHLPDRRGRARHDLLRARALRPLPALAGPQRARRLPAPGILGRCRPGALPLRDAGFASVATEVGSGARGRARVRCGGGGGRSRVRRSARRRCLERAGARLAARDRAPVRRAAHPGALRRALPRDPRAVAAREPVPAASHRARSRRGRPYRHPRRPVARGVA